MLLHIRFHMLLCNRLRLHRRCAALNSHPLTCHSIMPCELLFAFLIAASQLPSSHPIHLSQLPATSPLPGTQFPRSCPLPRLQLPPSSPVPPAQLSRSCPVAVAQVRQRPILVVALIDPRDALLSADVLQPSELPVCELQTHHVALQRPQPHVLG